MFKFIGIALIILAIFGFVGFISNSKASGQRLTLKRPLVFLVILLIGLYLLFLY